MLLAFTVCFVGNWSKQWYNNTYWSQICFGLLLDILLYNLDGNWMSLFFPSPAIMAEAWSQHRSLISLSHEKFSLVKVHQTSMIGL